MCQIARIVEYCEEKQLTKIAYVERIAGIN
jgi:hypothetical protein